MPRPKRLIPNLSEQDYAAIGKMAIEWSALEQYVAYAVGVLLGTNFDGAKVVATNTQYLAQCDMLKALLRLRFKLRRDEITALCRFIDDVNDDKPNHDDPTKRRSARARRNEIIHGSWIQSELPPRPHHIVTYKSKGGKLRHKVTPYDQVEVEALVSEIANLMDRLWDLLHPLLEEFQKQNEAARST